MTVQEIEKKIEEQDVVLKSLTSDNQVLKAETETVLKMSKKDRKLYGAMDGDERKAYMAADADKRKAMMEAKQKTKREKKLVDCMDDATRGEFEKAGPAKKEAMLKACADSQKAEKAAKAKAKGGVDSEVNPDDGDGDDDSEEKKAKNKMLTMKMAEADDKVTKANERIAKAEEQLTAINKRERLVSFTKRAEEELPHTSGLPEDKGAMLMTLADSLPGGEKGDAFTKMLQTLKAADKALAIHFGEVGKAGGEVPALKVFDAKVEEISKRDKIDTAHAIEKAMMENPELYLDYEQQHRQLTRTA